MDNAIGFFLYAAGVSIVLMALSFIIAETK